VGGSTPQGVWLAIPESWAAITLTTDNPVRFRQTFSKIGHTIVVY
jgi:hypothetical protein